MVMTLIAAGVLCAIVVRRQRSGLEGLGPALGLLLGAALGNLTDRFVRPPGGGQGHVVDFLDYNGWFIGNVADIWIVGGRGSSSCWRCSGSASTVDATATGHAHVEPAAEPDRSTSGPGTDAGPGSGTGSAETLGPQTRSKSTGWRHACLTSAPSSSPTASRESASTRASRAFSASREPRPPTSPRRARRPRRQGRRQVGAALAGSMLEVSLPRAEESPSLEVVAEPVPGMRIIHDDDDIIVVDKPVGVAAHPSVGWRAPPTSSVGLAAGLPHLDLGAAERQGIVSRLDVGIAGLMVVAKSEYAYTALKQAFRSRSVDKTYHALVQGLPDPVVGTIDAPIGRHPGHDYKFAVMKSGKPSVTHYEVIEAFRHASLLEIHLETGRTHQIRVHFAALHHPCCGDLIYGADPKLAARLSSTASGCTPWVSASSTRARGVRPLREPVPRGPPARARHRRHLVTFTFVPRVKVLGSGIRMPPGGRRPVRVSGCSARRKPTVRSGPTRPVSVAGARGATASGSAIRGGLRRERPGAPGRAARAHRTRPRAAGAPPAARRRAPPAGAAAAAPGPAAVAQDGGRRTPGRSP